MSKRQFYITTAIPYVNGDPHVGFALECVQADVLARHRRLRGEDVRFLSGTDDNSLKNVQAAEAAGVPVAKFVSEKARRFAGLHEPLELSYDDFISTSVDPRHRPAVERLWRACAAAGDLYEREYQGLYCIGCEAFLGPAELVGGLCPEHPEPPELVTERNWFFRLSAHQQPLLEAIQSGRLRIEPDHARNEALSFIRRGLEDFSVSRPIGRARGWGIAVPGDPSQVIYVWFDALCNYISALGYGGDRTLYARWWVGAGERVHVIGKGITRFHAIYWPAILRSAGEPLPTAVLVHDYLTVGGAKLSKSAAAESTAPLELATRFGSDALRWWFLRDVPRFGDADFRLPLLAARANELADELGNFVNRTIVLRSGSAGRVAPSTSGPPAGGARLHAAILAAPRSIDDALAHYDFRTATAALWEIVVQGNRFISSARPWELSPHAREGDASARARLQAVLELLAQACTTIAFELRPFLPGAADRITDAIELLDPQRGRSLFRKCGPPCVGE
ncbi:MAG: methionine--tRNA ligase [Actinomycetota bacterium]|nr:methionine--tRNA ligase [Actinomycetota bacterium]